MAHHGILGCEITSENAKIVPLIFSSEGDMERYARKMFLQRASNSGAKVSHAVIVMPSQPKVGDLGIEISIKQDIAGFDIPMHYSHTGFLMEIC